jgi:hypothetical protein
MRFVLDTRKVVRGGGFKDPLYTEYWNTIHLGTDYVASYVPFYAHQNCTILSAYTGKEGGNWLEIKGSDGYKLRAAHLSSYSSRSGYHKEGTVLAITGATGDKQTGPHLHLEVINPSGQHINPEEYFNNLLMENYARQFEGQTIMTSEEGDEKGKWYWVNNGHRWWIPDKATGWAFGLLESDIRWTSTKAITSIPYSGQLKYWDGYLYRMVDEISKNKTDLP